jgi:hypothetical protein
MVTVRRTRGNKYDNSTSFTSSEYPASGDSGQAIRNKKEIKITSRSMPVARIDKYVNTCKNIHENTVKKI